MKTTIDSIEVEEFDGDWSPDESDNSCGGQIYLTINDKKVTVIIHPCGEIDVDGPPLTEEEGEKLYEILHSKVVSKAFNIS